MSVGVAGTADDSEASGTLGDEVVISLAVVAEGGSAHPVDPAGRLLAVAQGQFAVLRSSAVLSLLT